MICIVLNSRAGLLDISIDLYKSVANIDHVMHIDIGRQLGAVNRGVTDREVTGSRPRRPRWPRPMRPRRTISGTRSRPRIAFRDGWLPIEGDLRLGGRYQLKGNAGGDDSGLRAAAPLTGDVGVRRRDELGRRQD